MSAAQASDQLIVAFDRANIMIRALLEINDITDDQATLAIINKTLTELIKVDTKATH